MNRSSGTARQDAETLVDELIELFEAYQHGPYGEQKEALVISVERILIGKTA
jgi:hypothetical protein